MTDQRSIGAFEAKTRLPAYLRSVVAGERFTITQRGKPVAELVPVGTAQECKQNDAAKRMLVFARRQQGLASKVDIKSLIQDGRD